LQHDAAETPADAANRTSAEASGKLATWRGRARGRGCRLTRTGVGPANPGHVEAFFIRLLDADRLNLRFTFGGGHGRSGVENILVRRIRRG